MNYQETKYKNVHQCGYNEINNDHKTKRRRGPCGIYLMLNSQGCARITNWWHFGLDKYVKGMSVYIEKDKPVSKSASRKHGHSCNWKTMINLSMVLFGEA